MIEHHIQKAILQKLIHIPDARYADLKPADMDGNIFSYHLHQLERAGLILKTEENRYALTASGKAEGINSNVPAAELHAQAHSILLLQVRDNDGKWLLRRRIVHPMHGYIGFLHGEPKIGQPVAETAADRLMQQTGLTASFRVQGSGYITLYKNDDLESYTHFTLLSAMDASGELIQSNNTGENIWIENPDFADTSYIPSMVALAKMTDTTGLFFVELTHHIA